jgi:hypothetical protein
MFSKKLVFGLCITFSVSAFSSYRDAENTYGKGSISLAGYRRILVNLVNDGYYFSSVPWMKDYLVKSSGALDGEMEKALDQLLTVTGVHPFENLPLNTLGRSKSANIRYIVAKKLFKKERYQEALAELGTLDSDHPNYPFSSHLKASILAIQGNAASADIEFKDCVRGSQREIGRTKSTLRQRQLQINHDYCVAGIARNTFAAKNYDKADLSYLDIPKSSYIWPEILFEEAWNSYYQKNYNRTLGKLVSYNAPVFEFIFNPEIEVLRAMSYMRMCLFDDAKKTVDGFYEKLLNPSRKLRTFLLGKGKDYSYFYQLVSDHEQGKPMPIDILNTLVKAYRKDMAYHEMKGSLTEALVEYKKLSQMSRSTFRSNLMTNIKQTVADYRRYVGLGLRAYLVKSYADLYGSFQDMSYIKLEVLAQRKERLYRSDEAPGKKRGDVQYISRNEKQYFWDFNGEFWADELGDYVFALRSECE